MDHTSPDAGTSLARLLDKRTLSQINVSSSLIAAVLAVLLIIVAARYPELVLHDQDPIQIGHFVSHNHTVEQGGLSCGRHRKISVIECPFSESVASRWPTRWMEAYSGFLAEPPGCDDAMHCRYGTETKLGKHLNSSAGHFRTGRPVTVHAQNFAFPCFADSAFCDRIVSPFGCPVMNLVCDRCWLVTYRALCDCP